MQLLVALASLCLCETHARLVVVAAGVGLHTKMYTQEQTVRLREKFGFGVVAAGVGLHTNIYTQTHTR